MTDPISIIKQAIKDYEEKLKNPEANDFEKGYWTACLQIEQQKLR